MLDGAARVDEVLAEAGRLGQTAMGITDHGYLFGAYDFYRKARKQGIKPVIGIEAYLTPGTSRFDKTKVRYGDEDQASDDVASSGAYTHLTLWAKDNTGLTNLFKLASLASLEGHYYKPRMDLQILSEYSAGIVATTGCPGGETSTRLRLGQYDEARAHAGQMQEIFGRENYFVELMDHGLDIERRVRTDLLQLAKDLGAPLVATNDLHYTKAEHAHAHEIYLCIGTNSVITDLTKDEGGRRFAFRGTEYYVKSAEQMRSLFSDLPEAIDNTVAIAEMCNVSFVEEVGRYMPHFPLPDGVDERTQFINQVWEGLAARVGGAINDEYRERAAYEIDVITSKGYAGYYLVVADFINWAKSQGIRVGPGRGSGAGSIAAWAMGITELDPIVHGLFFERFLNPERMSMPDFDVDFDERRRGEVIAYVQSKYGSDRVAQIVTYGTIKGKQALRDSARVLGYPYAKGDQLSKAMPAPVQGKDIALADVFNPKHERYGEGAGLRELYENDTETKAIVDAAMGIEGLKRQVGVHAAGIIIASEDLIDITPVMRREQDGAVITQIDFPAGENLGLVKMDFLGLRNLTILDDAIANIERNGKGIVDLETLPLDDEATYAMLSRADTLGVFQLDGAGMRALLRQMKPDSFDDIIAVGALYRPGPMGANSHTNYALRKNGLQRIDSIHPELSGPLADILEPTYGLIVYQEQVLQIAQRVAGYTLGRADLLRKAMGKKDHAVLAAEFVPFRDGMVANGFSDEAIQKLWDILVPFADYAFNKAHSAAYGLVAYWTAYLKAHYPVEYMAALLTSVHGDKAKSAIYLSECRRMGVTVLPPDVNESVAHFAAVGTDIRFGLQAVRNVGAAVVDAIVATRTESGDFTSFTDFLAKVPLSVCNKRTIESLIKSGVFDSLGHTRRSLMLVHEGAVESATEVKRSEAVGQFDLFAMDDEFASEASLHVSVPELDEWEEDVKLGFEREMLGQFVTGHPLESYRHVLASESDRTTAVILADEAPVDFAEVRLAGRIDAVNYRATKNGLQYATIVLEDLEGSIEAVVMGKAYQQFATLLVADSVVAVVGNLNVRDNGVSVRVRQIRRLAADTGATSPLTIAIPESRCNPAMVDGLKEIFINNPGPCPVRLKVTGADRETMLELGDNLRVERRQSLFEDLRALVGPTAFSS